MRRGPIGASGAVDDGHGASAARRNGRSRELIIFINRIDELDDTAYQVAEIEANFATTLKKHDVGADVPILFGSALWAQAALKDDIGGLPAPSRLALLNWGKVNPRKTFAERETDQETTWRLSGMPALHDLVAKCIVAGPRQAMQREVRDALSNLVTSIEASDIEVGMEGKTLPKVDPAIVATHVTKVKREMMAALKDANRFAIDALWERATKSQTMFRDRAVEALQSHIDAYGTGKAWQYNPAGLRMMLRTAYKTFRTDVERDTAKIYDDAARRIEGLYTDLFDVSPDRNALHPPIPAHAPLPAGVGKTIALDLSVSWWQKWWQGLRRQKPAVERYSELIVAETDSMLEELSTQLGPDLCRKNEAILTTFLETQRSALLSLAKGNGRYTNRGTYRTTKKLKTLRATRDLVDRMAA